jgi:hypothetical protein
MNQELFVTIAISFRRVFFLFGIVALCAPAAFAATDTEACSTIAESRQLDYWLGDWTIATSEVPGAATSKVYLVLDQCMLVESWKDGRGHAGENMFAYNPEEKSWHGMFADNRGHVHIFTSGRVALGTAEFDGPSHGPDGKTVLNRIRVVRLTADKVEQTWEQSSGNGVHWTSVFHGEYSRQKP